MLAAHAHAKVGTVLRTVRLLGQGLFAEKSDASERRRYLITMASGL